MSDRKYTENDRMMAALMISKGGNLMDAVKTIDHIHDRMPLAPANPADPETAALAETCEKLKGELDIARFALATARIQIADLRARLESAEAAACEARVLGGRS